jgi:hypothetical protein
MPGIPQGRDVGEHGPKSVTLASVLDDGSITMEERRASWRSVVRLPRHINLRYDVDVCSDLMQGLCIRKQPCETAPPIEPGLFSAVIVNERDCLRRSLARASCRTRTAASAS